MLHVRRRALYGTVALLLGGYFLLLGNDLTQEGNFAARVDRFLLGGHLWKGTWDPEGLLSTFPAIATTILGYLAGERLSASDDGHETAAALFTVGWVLVLGGLFWSIWFPINKNLWTSSYVLFTAGAALSYCTRSRGKAARPRASTSSSTRTCSRPGRGRSGARSCSRSRPFSSGGS